jgi:hypothetical protein
VPRARVFYDCRNCPSYCCAYPRIQVGPEDVLRLARHHGLDLEKARRRFTRNGQDPGEVILRHHRDRIYGTVCRFLDARTRLCTVHEARPDVCREHPGSPSCAYYAFLMAERRKQRDPGFVARTYNLV